MSYSIGQPSAADSHDGGSPGIWLILWKHRIVQGRRGGWQAKVRNCSDLTGYAEIAGRSGRCPVKNPNFIALGRRAVLTLIPQRKDNMMDTTIDEVAAGIYRFSTFVPQVAAPAGLTFNQFLVLGDEPLLFHCGHRRMFPLIAAALAKVLLPERLRWISFGHIEAEECGAMNEWLAIAPQATIAHGATASLVSLDDMADRAPRTLADGEVVDIGGKRLRYLDTPHVPHGWEAGLLFEETTGTLLCGDLFTHPGNGPAVTEADIVGPGMGAGG